MDARPSRNRRIGFSARGKKMERGTHFCAGVVETKEVERIFVQGLSRKIVFVITISGVKKNKSFA
jgi:hypothetical protein